MAKKKKILVIIDGALGDMIVATPALRAIRQANTGDYITYFTNSLMRQIAPAGTYADELIEDDARGSKNVFTFLGTAWILRNRQFDVTINLRYTSERSALLTFLCGAPHRAGAGPLHWMWCYTQRIPYPPSHYNELFRYTDFVKALGYPVQDTTPFVYYNEQHHTYADDWFHAKSIISPIVCLHPGASRNYRAWLPERFAEIGRRIHRKTGHKILVTYGAAERQIAEFVAAEIGEPALLAPPTPEVGHLAALFSRCILVICNNSGAMHVAVAANTPVVALHGATELEDWQPIGEMHRSIKSPVIARRWNPAEERRAMDALTIQAVWEIVEKRLEELVPSVPAA